MMKNRILATAAAALTVGAALMATTESADAQRWRGRTAAAIGAGVVGGLALGAIAASAARPRYYYDHYDYGPAYGGPVYYDPPYAETYYPRPAYRTYAYPGAYAHPRADVYAYGYAQQPYWGQGGITGLDADTPSGAER